MSEGNERFRDFAHPNQNRPPAPPQPPQLLQHQLELHNAQVRDYAFLKIAKDHPAFARIYLDYAVRKLGSEEVQASQPVRFGQPTRAAEEGVIVRTKLQEDSRKVRIHQDYSHTKTRKRKPKATVANQVATGMAAHRHQVTNERRSPVMGQVLSGLGVPTSNQTTSYNITQGHPQSMNTFTGQGQAPNGQEFLTSNQVPRYDVSQTHPHSSNAFLDHGQELFGLSDQLFSQKVNQNAGLGIGQPSSHTAVHAVNQWPSQAVGLKNGPAVSSMTQYSGQVGGDVTGQIAGQASGQLTGQFGTQFGDYLAGEVNIQPSRKVTCMTALAEHHVASQAAARLQVRSRFAEENATDVGDQIGRQSDSQLAGQMVGDIGGRNPDEEYRIHEAYLLGRERFRW